MLMLKGRAKAIAHSLRHFGNPKHRIWRAMKDVTWLEDLLSCGTGADIAVFCECGEVFDSYIPLISGASMKCTDVK